MECLVSDSAIEQKLILRKKKKKMNQKQRILSSFQI